MLLATINKQIPLSALAADGGTAYFGTARIYDGSGSLITTLPLVHADDGLYIASYMPTIEGVFSIVYQLYTDIARTIPAPLDRGIESLDVSDERINIKRILGLVHENSVVDQQTYNGNGMLLTARIRNYDSKANADLAGATGLLFTWYVTAIYSGLNLINFKITKDV
jgi:hypothetical protein